MESAKLPKFKWDEVSELNSGHTSDEWGVRKLNLPKSIVAYTVSWDV